MPIYLYVLEADTDADGGRFRMGITDADYTNQEFARTEEKSFATLNDLCAALREAVVVPIYPDIARLRAAIDHNDDFFLEIGNRSAGRLGFAVPELVN